MKNVTGKTALVTGGAMGMGKLLGDRFLRDGAKLVVWDVNREALDKTLAEWKQGGHNVAGHIIDITDAKKVAELAKQVGQVDVLVNNAGIAAGGIFGEVSIEKHIRVIDVNINAVMICTHAFLPGMIERNDGHVVNIASAAGLMGMPSLTSYCASKFAVVGFTETLRMELFKMRKTGVKTTTVCPSLVATGMFAGAVAPKMSKFLKPEYMADKIYEGMKKDKIYVKEPWIVRTIPFVKSISHPDRLTKFNEFLGVSTAMDNYYGREKEKLPSGMK